MNGWLASRLWLLIMHGCLEVFCMYPCLLAELCESGSLSQAVKAGVFRPQPGRTSQLAARRMLVRTVTEICRGMLHLHTANILHGERRATACCCWCVRCACVVRAWRLGYYEVHAVRLPYVLADGWMIRRFYGRCHDLHACGGSECTLYRPLVLLPHYLLRALGGAAAGDLKVRAPRIGHHTTSQPRMLAAADLPGCC